MIVLWATLRSQVAVQMIGVAADALKMDRGGGDSIVSAEQPVQVGPHPLAATQGAILGHLNVGR